MPEALTTAYFASSGHGFWQWQQDEDGPAAIVWHNGATLLFRPELQQLLAALVPTGFPPLNGLLLVVAALGERWDTALATAAVESGIGEQIPADIRACLEEVLAELNNLHRLPASLRTPPALRKLLLQAIFENSKKLLPTSNAEDLLADFRQTHSIVEFQQTLSIPIGLGMLRRDLLVLREALATLDFARLEQRLTTGLEFEVKPWAADPGNEVVDLLVELQQESDELALVAGVVRHLTAVLTFPRPLVDADSLPLGGITDIANRGPLDRLLLTEHAWDSLTFAVRLAQGEALYARRETPPASPPPASYVLLDTTVFLWGKPRLFALGAALTLLRQSTTAPTTVLAYGMGKFQHILLHNLDAVRGFLTRLDPAEDCAAGLPKFVQELAASNPPPRVILITHPASLATVVRSEVWQDLSGVCSLHSIAVDRVGQLVFSEHTSRGTKHFRTVQVDLDQLLAAHPKGTAPVACLTNEQVPLPIFYDTFPWPLLTPDRPIKSGFYQLAEGAGTYVGVTQHGAVAAWQDPRRMGRIHAILPLFPLGQLMHLAADGDARICLWYANEARTEFRFHFVDLTGGQPPASVARPTQGYADVRSGPSFYFSYKNGTAVLHVPGQSYAIDPSGILDQASISSGLFMAKRLLFPLWLGKGFGELEKPPSSGSRVAPQPAVTNWMDYPLLAMAVDGQGLRVKTVDGRVFRLHLTPRGLHWGIASLMEAAEWHPFSDFPGAKGEALKLRQSRLPQSRRAVHDPRGFLHLLMGAPEQLLTVVLMPGLTAAWRDAGHFHGRSEFLLGKATANDQVLVKHFLSFCAG